jgi:hypothetical protein
MKRLLALLMALAGLTALFAGCGGGGEEEAASLAVAFRLDEGSPVMVAYIGDPTEDPFELPAGRYYIEALDGDDVLISLGAVDVEEGDVVDFPTSFEAAGEVADAERAEPLITLASFLIDLELAKHTYLEIVTGGFTVSPFDPSVELDAADFEGLFEMYGDIAEQEDAVLEALDKIEGRAEVSSGLAYVRSSWASGPDEFNWTKEEVGFLMDLLGQAQATGEAADTPDEASQQAGYWVIPLEGDRFQTDVTREEGTWIKKTPETLAMFNKWREYAKKLVQDLGPTPEKTSSDQARKELTEKVRSDLQKWAPNVPTSLIDEAVSFFANEVAKVVPDLPSAPAPGQGQTKPDTSWIEGFVQKVAKKLLDQGHSGLDVAAWADDLRHCLTAYVEQGLSQEDAAAMCVWVIEGFAAHALETTSEEPSEPEAEEPAEPEAEEPSEPEAEEPSEPEAEEPSEPEAEEPSEPEAEEPSEPEAEEPSEPEAEEPSEPEPEEPTEPEAPDVRAEGPWLLEYELSPGCVVEKNTMWLRFSPGDGSVNGKGEWLLSCEHECGTVTTSQVTDYEGIYSPDSNTFGGSWVMQITAGYYTIEGEQCQPKSHSSNSAGHWEATLTEGIVKGSNEIGGEIHFELTVQG